MHWIGNGSPFGTAALRAPASSMRPMAAAPRQVALGQEKYPTRGPVTEAALAAWEEARRDEASIRANINALEVAIGPADAEQALNEAAESVAAAWEAYQEVLEQGI